VRRLSSGSLNTGSSIASRKRGRRASQDGRSLQLGNEAAARRLARRKLALRGILLAQQGRGMPIPRTVRPAAASSDRHFAEQRRKKARKDFVERELGPFMESSRDPSN
jgi:hypothetical protein